MYIRILVRVNSDPCACNGPNTFDLANYIVQMDSVANYEIIGLVTVHLNRVGDPPCDDPIPTLLLGVKTTHV
jgi:hypothetical protein